MGGSGRFSGNATRESDGAALKLCRGPEHPSLSYTCRSVDEMHSFRSAFHRIFRHATPHEYRGYVICGSQGIAFGVLRESLQGAESAHPWAAPMRTRPPAFRVSRIAWSISLYRTKMGPDGNSNTMRESSTLAMVNGFWFTAGRPRPGVNSTCPAYIWRLMVPAIIVPPRYGSRVYKPLTSRYGNASRA